MRPPTWPPIFQPPEVGGLFRVAQMQLDWRFYAVWLFSLVLVARR